MSEFTASYSEKHNEYEVTIVDESAVFTITLLPKELQTLIDCLQSIKESIAHRQELARLTPVAPVEVNDPTFPDEVYAIWTGGRMQNMLFTDVFDKVTPRQKYVKPALPDVGQVMGPGEPVKIIPYESDLVPDAGDVEGLSRAVKSIMVAGNHLAGYIIDAKIKRESTYDEVLHKVGQPYADIFIAWKRIMELRDAWERHQRASQDKEEK